MIDYYGFNFPHSFLLGDPEWFHRLGLQISIDDFDPFNDGLDYIFETLHDVLKGDKGKKRLNGCYMFSHEFSPFLQNMGLIDKFREARRCFEKRNNIAFEPIIHVSTQQGNFPLDGHYLQVLKDELESCASINAKSLVIHLPEVPRDVTKRLIDLFCSSTFIDLLSSTDVALFIENGLHNEYFGSLQNILNFSSILSDKLSERGFKRLIPRIKTCFDTGHLILWRYHHKDGQSYADKEIEVHLPEFVKRTGVLHVKACDSTKEYITPFARKGSLFLEHSKKVMDWIEVVKETKISCPRYFCMEIPKRNFVIKEIINFRKKII